MARTVIGLDLGLGSLGAVGVTISFRGRELAFSERRVLSLADGAAGDAELIAAWARACQELKAAGRIPDGATIVASLPGAWAATRSLELPFGDPKKIDAALDGELDFQQTIADVATLASGWAVIGPARDGLATEILAATCDRGRVKAVLDGLAAVGCEPQHLLHPAAAYANLWQPRQAARADGGGGEASLSGDGAHADAPTPDPAAAASALARPDELTMLVDIGATRTNVCVVAGGRLRACRTINWGADRCDGLVAEALRIQPDQARALREREGRLYLGALLPPSTEHEHMSAALIAAHQALAQQLRVTLSAARFAPQQRVAVWLTGGGAELRGLERWLAGELDADVQVRSPTTMTSGHWTGAAIDQPAQVLAASLALAGARGRRGLLLDLRRGELAATTDVAWARGLALRSAAGVVAVIVFALAGLFVEYRASAALELRLDQQFCQLTRQTLRKEVCDPRAALAAMSSPGGPTGQGIPAYSAVDLLVMLSAGIGDDINVVFSELELRLDRIIIKGTCGDFETLEKLNEKLKTLPCVSDVKQTRSNKQGSAEVEFGLTLKVECPDGGHPLPGEH